MPQSPLLGHGAVPSIPVTGTSIGYDPGTTGSPATDVQDELDRLEALIAAGPGVTVKEADSSPSVVATSIVVPNGSEEVAGTTATLHLLTSRAGEQGETQTITASGAAQTLDLSLYNTFDITLTASCTLTFSNSPPGGVDAHWTIILRQGGSGSYTVTWPGTVDWQDPTDGTTGGSAPTLWTAVGAQNSVDISTLDGGTTYGGTMGGGSSLVVKDEGTPLATAASSLDFVGAGVTASGATAAKTVTIPGYTDAQVLALIPAAVGSEHVHVAYETHTSDGSTVTFTLDQAYEENSVMAWNRTTGTMFGVTEVLPDQATLSAAGSAADLIDFHYAASVI